MKRILSVGWAARRIALASSLFLLAAVAGASSAAPERLPGHTLSGLPAKVTSTRCIAPPCLSACAVVARGARVGDIEMSWRGSWSYGCQ